MFLSKWNISYNIPKNKNKNVQFTMSHLINIIIKYKP